MFDRYTTGPCFYLILETGPLSVNLAFGIDLVSSGSIAGALASTSIASPLALDQLRRDVFALDDRAALELSVDLRLR